MHEGIKEILFTAEQIHNKVKELGKKITEDYKDKDLMLICILKGSFIFMSDLCKEINLPLTLDFIAVSSYGDSTQSSGVVRIIKDLEENIEGKHILIVEDIIDTGLTLSYLINNLKSRGSKSIKICTLLDKPERRKSQVKPDYLGFTIPDKFVVGYGLDYAEKYRNLPFVSVLKEEIYKKTL